MSDKQSSSAPEPRVLIECPDGCIMVITDKPEVFQAVVARESQPPYEIIPIPCTISKPEPESPTTTEPTIKYLASQLGRVIQKMEILDKEKKEIMEKIRARGGNIRIPKD
ncbi:hypothetical protein FVEG_06613 [Fusarium verticillioides 7600]|uniref:Uncharacterized protein n=1 Tax=Gibberella moniliformis (strain M3125 / FGSC 7600) TaxID=334819 RepID=W7MMW3_GIBM7|nr:hypothetical protein FVEG_06613 [Fusarium verticillioides 7600]EWG45987.1 hypothetical protein FVEG_06613 [Fusarium verticillioides 7600]